MKITSSLITFLIAALLFFACSEPEEEVFPVFDELEGLSDYERDVVEYFREIALGFEFGTASRITRKWVEPMRLFVGGEPTQTHLLEFKGIVDEINHLATDGFEIIVVEDTLQSNAYLFFGSATEYGRKFPGSSANAASNWGLFSVYIDDSENLVGARMWVDTHRPSNGVQLHLLREELTQSTGFGQDSHRYPDSIFQQEFSRVIKYSEIDKDLIRLLYHPKMTSGLGATSVLEVLREIFEEGD